MARAADKSSTDSEKTTEKPASGAGRAESAGKGETPTSKGEAAAASEPQSESKEAKGAAGLEDAAQDAGAEAGEPTPAETQGASAGASPSTYLERMKTQHKALQEILDRRSAAETEPFEIARAFAVAWLPHALVEREVLRGVGRGGEAGDAIAEIEIRKDLVNLLLANLLDRGPRGAEKAALEALAEQFSALVQRGQREEGGLLQAIEQALASGRLQMQQIERREERARSQYGDLDDESIGEAIEMLAPRRLSVHEERQPSEWEQSMPRYSSQGRDRDEQGRFQPEDERGYGRGGSRETPQRDEGGRFVSDDRRMRGRTDEDQGRGRRMSQRDSDEDERYGSSSRDRGQGGWFGDREGHSEASRRGWENSDHGRSGWYGDREGHSEASRRGWENSDHGRSGWYGDSEGHSEASRRGWEEGHRSQRRDDDEGGRYRGRSESDERRGGYEGRAGGSHEGRGGGYEGRGEGRGGGYEGRGGGYESRGGGYESRGGGRYEDDDERGSSRGHGGWSGDPEGHSEAARRGWENRRR